VAWHLTRGGWSCSWRRVCFQHVADTSAPGNRGSAHPGPDYYRLRSDQTRGKIPGDRPMNRIDGWIEMTGAEFSADRRYRYVLWRYFWTEINPVDEATARLCMFLM